MARRAPKRHPEARFLAAVTPGPVPDRRPDLGPCLLFTGALQSNGYGQFRYLERNGYAHRFAWIRAHGAIPEGMTLDHLCMVKRCVEISHLELVTPAENYRRFIACRTKCKNGHDLPVPGPCRPCELASDRRYYARKVGRVLV